jgi:cell wall assembly regulator SMI1
MTIKITSDEKVSSIADIKKLEEKLQITFPEDYRNFLAKVNVGMPESNIIKIQKLVTSISMFYGVSNNDTYDISANVDTFSGRLPDQVISIAEAGGGNQICLQLDTGAVFFWDHEMEATEDEVPSYDNMSLLAPSFNDFLQMIQPYSEDQAVRDTSSMSIISVKKKPGADEKFKDYLKK